MTSQGEKVNDLEARIEQTIDRATDDWMNDPRINTSYHTHVAQAIVREFGLEVVSDGGRPEWKLQVIGKWEKQ